MYFNILTEIIVKTESDIIKALNASSIYTL